MVWWWYMCLPGPLIPPTGSSIWIRIFFSQWRLITIENTTRRCWWMLQRGSHSTKWQVRGQPHGTTGLCVVNNIELYWTMRLSLGIPAHKHHVFPSLTALFNGAHVNPANVEKAISWFVYCGPWPLNQDVWGSDHFHPTTANRWGNCYLQRLRLGTAKLRMRVVWTSWWTN